MIDFERIKRNKYNDKSRDYSNHKILWLTKFI